MAAMALHANHSATSQVGGANPIDIILKHLDSVPNMIYGFVLIIAISFADKVSPSLSDFADTALGRVLGIGLIVGIVHFMGWAYGLLTAVAYLLIVHSSKRLSSLQNAEGFAEQEFHEAQGSRWFVERVLGEKPKEIITDTVTTQAVQSLGNSSRR
jgi:hypothetical protein